MSNIRLILNDPVTKHMRTDPTRLKVGQTVGDALEYLRRNPPGGRAVYLYVVDGEDCLQGVVPVRRLLFADPATPLADVMVKNVVAIPPTATVLDACEFFALHRLLAFPVVDSERRLLGLVDVDLYTEELADIERHREDEDLFQLVGVHLTEAEQRKTGLAFRRRFPWLMCNVAGGMLAAFLTDAYEDVATLALVTPFISLVTALSESVSMQSVSLALQSLHGRPPTWRSLARTVGREAVIGLLLGAASGLVVGLIALGWKGHALAGLSLFLGIAGGVAWSAASGLAMPYLLRLLRWEPQVAAGPLALAVCDVVTLLLYFNLGRWLLG